MDLCTLYIVTLYLTYHRHVRCGFASEGRCLLRSGSGGLIEEADGDSALSHTAEEVALTRTERLEVTFPSFVGREDGEAVMRFEQVAGRCIIIVVSQRFRDRRNPVE